MLSDNVFMMLWIVLMGVSIFAAQSGPWSATLGGGTAIVVLVYTLFLQIQYTELAHRTGEEWLAGRQRGERLQELRRQEIAAVVAAVAASDASRAKYQAFHAGLFSRLAGEPERSDLHWPLIP
ncbi:MAG TPA: hypothetical protein VEG60_10550 [Candidatus Binatia bacterium]|nr:hypothetical protein [Candidatus Binatia bacterium]